MLQNTLDLVREHTGNDLPRFTECVQRAFKEVAPIFLRPRYGEFFWHCSSTVPGWLPRVVLANARMESDGSAKLLSLWQDINYSSEIEDQVLFHATDEARHSRLFVKLVSMAFPGMFADGALSTYRGKLTKIEKHKLVKSATPIDVKALIDNLVQMNMGEIRTRLHMELIAPVLHAFTPDESKAELECMLQGLAHDEIVHIGYIAGILEEMCADGDSELVRSLYVRRLRDFNELTRDQTQGAVASFGAGRFPDLLEI
jgi:hypothetical protein